MSFASIPDRKKSYGPHGAGYLVSPPNCYIAVTGIRIDDIKIVKKWWRHPLQRALMFDISPQNYKFDLHAMSIEKLEFMMPGVFTIGPNLSTNQDDNIRELTKYARFLAGDDSLEMLVLGIIEGTARVCSSSMTIEEIFNNRVAFKDKIILGVNDELEQFGLKVYNANIKELQDSPGNDYFKNQRQKILSYASNQAKLDVAEAEAKGTIGKTTKDCGARVETAIIHTDTVIKENDAQERQQESTAHLKTRQIEFAQGVEVADVVKTQAVLKRRAELERDVAMANQSCNLERIRATDFTRATVDYEISVKRAEAEAKAVTLAADASLYEIQQRAKATEATYDANIKGITGIVNAFGGDTRSALIYLMSQMGTLGEITKHNAEALRGMSPKITVLGGSGTAMEQTNGLLAGLYNTLPQTLAMFDAVGARPPNWVAQ